MPTHRYSPLCATTPQLLYHAGYLWHFDLGLQISLISLKLFMQRFNHYQQKTYWDLKLTCKEQELKCITVSYVLGAMLSLDALRIGNLMRVGVFSTRMCLQRQGSPTAEFRGPDGEILR
jgi:hypothetical protein